MNELSESKKKGKKGVSSVVVDAPSLIYIRIIDSLIC